MRVGRRGEIESDRARKQRVVERIEIGQKTAFARCGQIDRLAGGGERAGGHRPHKTDWESSIAGLPARRRDPALGGNGREKQAFARAVEHQHFAFGIDRAWELVAAVEPSCDRAAERLDAFVGRVATKIRKMRSECRADEGRDRVLRLAD